LQHALVAKFGQVSAVLKVLSCGNSQINASLTQLFVDLSARIDYLHAMLSTQFTLFAGEEGLRGKSIMKRLIQAACLVAILGASAIAAHAQTPVVDPLTAIKNGSSPPCTGNAPGDIQCLTPDPDDSTMSLTLPYADPLTFDFAYDDTAHDIPAGSELTEFILEYTGVPSLTSFECESNIWADCAQSNDGSGDYFFTFTGSGPCILDSTVYSCPGFLLDSDPSDPPGATGTNTPLVSDTPEPGTMVLFGSGLILLAAIMRRKIQAQTQNLRNSI
jgi:hypothetical protein